MSIDAAQVYDVARSTVQSISIDWGENTSGTETGVLDAGDTVASCAVAIASGDKPSGAADPTFGSVAVNSTAVVINGRTCSAGEATACTMTLASDQAYGAYRVKFTATTTSGFVVPRWVRFRVVEPQ
jgi:hypothetical protein